jgi:hypothetical protein
MRTPPPSITRGSLDRSCRLFGHPAKLMRRGRVFNDHDHGRPPAENHAGLFGKATMPYLAISLDIGPGCEVVLERLPGAQVRISCIKGDQVIGKPAEIPQGDLAAKLDAIHAALRNQEAHE